MLPSFNYYQPASLQEALILLASLPRSKKLLAGGTDLVPALRRGELYPANVVSISGLSEMKEIKMERGLILIGALAAFSDLVSSPCFEGAHRLVAEAAGQIGGPQIRNQGTVGGNIVNASPAGDMLPPLVALGAKVRLCREAGERAVSLSDFLGDAGGACITPEEILVEVSFPALPVNAASSFVKLGRRNSLAISRISMAAVIIYDLYGRIEEARLALGSVGPKPVRMPSAEALLKGQRPAPDLLEEAVASVGEAVGILLGSRASAPYKKAAVRGVARQVLQKADPRFMNSGEING